MKTEKEIFKEVFDEYVKIMESNMLLQTNREKDSIIKKQLMNLKK